MASINTRKRGITWEYRFETAKVDGKRKQVSKGGYRTKKEALEAGTKALAEYNNSGLVFEPTNISISDYMDYWMEHYVLVNCKYNTVCCYKNIVEKHIKPDLGLYKLSSLTPTICQQFINSKFKNGYSKNHLTNIMCVLTNSLNYAVQPCEFIRFSPAAYIKKPKYEQNTDKKKILNLDQFNQIIQRFPEYTSFYISLMIGFHAGLHISEVMALTWDDIDFDNGTLSVNKILIKKDGSWYFGTPKTHASLRTIQIGETLITALRHQKKWQLENSLHYGSHLTRHYLNSDNNITSVNIELPIQQLYFVNTKENGDLLTPESMKYTARVIHYDLNIDFNFHSLRHTHATMLIESGANIKDVQTRLGHTDVKTTLNTYTHDTEFMKKETVDLFEQKIKALSTN